VNLVDSSGWIEYFVDGPNANFFAPPIENTKQLLIPTICLYEVFKKILQDRSEGEALQAVAHMKQGQVVGLDENLSLLASKQSHRLKIPMADSIILACAIFFHAKLWTQDEHFKSFPGIHFRRKTKS